MRYFDFCDSLWDWFFDGSLGERLSSRLIKNRRNKDRFNLEFFPEPFLVFGNSRPNYRNSLHLMMANPGQGIPKVQTAESIRAGIIPEVNEEMRYRDAASKIGNFYLKYFKGKPNLRAGLRRYETAHKFAKECGFDGLVNVDTIPWHSHRLPEKDKLPDLIKECPISSEYYKQLSEYLADKSVLSLDGWLDEKKPWLKFKAERMGMDFNRAECLRINETNDNQTGKAFIYRTDVIKIQYVVKGHNNMPGPKGRDKLSKEIRKWRESKR